MVPFRSTPERVWLSVHDLRSEQRDERGYEVVMGYPLYADWVTSGDWFQYGEGGRDGERRIMGLPIKIDPKMPRGWLTLRHEVTR